MPTAPLPGLAANSTPSSRSIRPTSTNIPRGTAVVDVSAAPSSNTPRAISQMPRIQVSATAVTAGLVTAKIPAIRAMAPIAASSPREPEPAPGQNAWASEPIPSARAHTPHSRASAVAVSSGQTMARMPNTMATAPRTTSAFQLTLNQSPSTEPPPHPSRTS